MRTADSGKALHLPHNCLKMEYINFPFCKKKKKKFTPVKEISICKGASHQEEGWSWRQFLSPQRFLSARQPLFTSQFLSSPSQKLPRPCRRPNSYALFILRGYLSHHHLATSVPPFSLCKFPCLCAKLKLVFLLLTCPAEIVQS